VLQIILINIFVTTNLLFFFIYFEAVLLPMLLVIGMWGSRQRKIHALYYLFFYTLVGSVFMLTGIIYIYIKYGILDYYYLLHTKFTFEEEVMLVTLFFIGFAVKVPIWPFHIWLPEAHVESPTSGSVILAGILLKLGTYGLLRYLLPLFPNGAYYIMPFIYTLCLLGVVFCSCIILRQVDFKKIIAYSSVIHMSYCIIGLFSFDFLGIAGSILTMFSHGVIAGALFFLVGSLYEKYHTRNILYYSGLSTIMPIHATYFLLFSLANMSLPGLFSFVGELLILMGLVGTSFIVFIILTIFTFFSVVYSIWLYNRICFGAIKKEYITMGYDCSTKEIVIFSFLSTLTVIFGIFPELLLVGIEESLVCFSFILEESFVSIPDLKFSWYDYLVTLMEFDKSFDAFDTKDLNDPNHWFNVVMGKSFDAFDTKDLNDPNHWSNIVMGKSFNKNRN
jgi:NADH-quinone oxidoreductase subunit M